jgi:ketosteroid isomerase-like protein
MPVAQSYQYQSRVTILYGRSPRRHRLYRSRRQLWTHKPVAALDTVYQAAVKANDIAIMDQILADDFVLVTDRGASLTKADLIKEAREKRTIYEHQEVEEGTKKVRVWRDTAVVTALLRIKGTRDQNPFDYKVWFSETYVRTATGWRYVFGQASISSPKPNAK